jgi:ribose transport system substrate-binding protein
MVRAWMFGTLAAFLACFTVGCSDQGGAKDPTQDLPSTSTTKGAGRVVFVANGNSDWWSAVETGMKDAGIKFKSDVELKRNGGGVEGQIRLLEEALSASDVKGVAVSPVNGNAPGISDAMKKLKDAGKFVITIDSDINPSASETRSFYIGTDNVKAGEVAGKAAAELRPQGGTVAVFVGEASALNAQARLDGFYTGAGPKFVKPPTEIFEDQHNDDKAQSLAEVAITKHPETGVMLGLYSYNGPRIAVEAAKVPDFRKKTTIVTFDLDELAVEQLEMGNIDVSVCQNPYEIGFQAVKLLKALIADDKPTVEEMFPQGKTTFDTGVRVIVPTTDSPVKGSNVISIKDMKEWLKGKNLKSS